MFDWNEYRRQMLEETSRWIEWALDNPDKVVEIPSKPVGEGGWPRQVGSWFWGTVLHAQGGEKARHWMNVLLQRPRGEIARWRRQH